MVLLLLPQLYPFTAQTLSCAPICIGIVTVVSVGGWVLPVYGGRYGFKGPLKTITDEELRRARVEGRVGREERSAGLENVRFGDRKVEG